MPNIGIWMQRTEASARFSRHCFPVTSCRRHKNLIQLQFAYEIIHSTPKTRAPTKLWTSNGYTLFHWTRRLITSEFAAFQQTNPSRPCRSEMSRALTRGTTDPLQISPNQSNTYFVWNSPSGLQTPYRGTFKENKPPAKFNFKQPCWIHVTVCFICKNPSVFWCRITYTSKFRFGVVFGLVIAHRARQDSHGVAEMRFSPASISNIWAPRPLWITAIY